MKNISLKDLPTYVKHRLSLCLIAKNEAESLPRLFKSLGNFKGEILIVDTGSSDNTVELARTFGATVITMGSYFCKSLSQDDVDKIEKTFRSPIRYRNGTRVSGGDTFFDFGAARNFAIDQCTNDIIIMPDCDEYFVDVNWDLIQYFFDQNLAEALQCQLAYTSDVTLNKAVVFDRKKYRYKHIIHEIAINIELNPDMNKCLLLPHQIFSLKQKQDNKPRTYILPLLYCYFRFPEDIRYKFYLAREFAYDYTIRDHKDDNNYDAAKLLMELVEYIEKTNMAKESVKDLDEYDTYYTLISTFMGLKQWDRALYYSFHSLNFVGPRPEIFIMLSEIYLEKAQFDRATIYAQSAINSLTELGFEKFATKTYCFYYEKPYVTLYNSYYVQNQYDKALEVYETIKKYAPKRKPEIHILICEQTKNNIELAETLKNYLIKKDGGGKIVKIVDPPEPDIFEQTIVIGAHATMKKFVYFPKTIIFNNLLLDYTTDENYQMLMKRFMVWESDSRNLPLLKTNQCKYKFVQLDCTLTIPRKMSVPLIVIHSSQNVSWNPENPHKTASGSEIMAMNLAQQFTKMGYRVCVFGSFPSERKLNEVNYMDNSGYLKFIEENYIDHLIVSRFPENIVYRDWIQQVYLWLHDILPAYKRNNMTFANLNLNPQQFKGIICLSQWHKQIILETGYRGNVCNRKCNLYR